MSDVTLTEDEIRRDERRKTAEAIARAIEVAQGIRCPECGGKSASTRSDGRQDQRRCGGNHTWWSSSRVVHPAEIARQHGNLCCDLHNANCEPPADLCCRGCTEAAHPEHPRGVPCVLTVAVPRGYPTPTPRRNP
ncbi:hypothetical protein [Verrucosispora sp. WMMC514]|uniref:hypothetical protein n=1 Tax=Verrucosispora sp. WMMC514 TaxID=3015156 RepID=UPI00248A9FB1|nr:hypothetical protein [Verrucosispora sp. WMMC514]WBB94113.1 hypothetical protein O7597_14790 [Verrucosispora sp. WMMC514]